MILVQTFGNTIAAARFNYLRRNNNVTRVDSVPAPPVNSSTTVLDPVDVRAQEIMDTLAPPVNYMPRQMYETVGTRTFSRSYKGDKYIESANASLTAQTKIK